MDGHQRTIPARAQVVNGPGHQFLAAATRTENQYSAVARSHLANDLIDDLHGRAAADNVFNFNAPKVHQ